MRKNSRQIGAPRAVLGFTLVELMVSLVLGMIVTAAALAMFLSNKQVYATNEHLGRAQESVRTAYELMSRDMREASGGVCEAKQKTVNVLRNPTTRWWTDFSQRMIGYNGSTATPQLATGSGAGARVAGTDAIDLKAGVSDSVSISSHTTGTGTLTLNTTTHGFSTGDIVMVCDFDHAAIAQLTSAANGAAAVVTGSGGGFVPGNCTTALGYSDPVDCATPVVWPFPALSQIARMRMTRWYIGVGGNGTGRSLYQQTVVNVAGTPTVQTLEIAPNVENMQLSYLVAGGSDYAAASASTNWAKVTAVRVVLSVRVDPNGNGGDSVIRRLEHTVTLRNRI